MIMSMERGRAFHFEKKLLLIAHHQNCRHHKA